MIRFFFSIALALLLLPLSIHSQVDTLVSPKMVITLKNGIKYTGRIESAEKLHLIFLTETSGKVEIAKDSIDQIIRYEDLPLSEKQKELKTELIDTTHIVEYTDRNLSRMILFPTARSMKAGQVYIQLNELFFPYAAVGIADVVTIGGGVSLWPSNSGQFIYLSPKITPLHYKGFDLAGGVFYSTSPQHSSSTFLQGGFGFTYAMGTFGDNDRSISFGLGYGFSGDNFSKKPLIIIGGDIKISKGLKFITENWFPPESKNFISFIGFRAIGKHVSGDAVLIKSFGSDSWRFGYFPWFNITYNFDLYN